MKALVLGLGNSILSDDGVGLALARDLRGKMPGVEVDTTCLVGLGVLDLVDGYETLFVIDAFASDRDPPGTLKKLHHGDGALHLFSSHGLDFFEILRLGRELGYRVPESVCVYGISIGREVSFGEQLSPKIRERMGSILETIAEDIRSRLADATPPEDRG